MVRLTEVHSGKLWCAVTGPLPREWSILGNLTTLTLHFNEGLSGASDVPIIPLSRTMWLCALFYTSHAS